MLHCTNTILHIYDKDNSTGRFNSHGLSIISFGDLFCANKAITYWLLKPELFSWTPYWILVMDKLGQLGHWSQVLVVGACCPNVIIHSVLFWCPPR